MTISRVNAALRTDTGRVRDHNEDYVGSWEPTNSAEQSQIGWLYIVSDGVGGAEAGEVASQMATETIIRDFVNSTEPTADAALIEAVQSANTTLRHTIAETQKTMATTCVAVSIRDDQAVFVNVGDSRGYLLRDGTAIQITKDQSLVAKLVEEGTISAEEAVNHPRRNVILSSIGPSRAPQIDTFHLTLQPNDQLLLCSDGLTDHVGTDDIISLTTDNSIDNAATALVALANSRGGSDNISIALLRPDLQNQQNRWFLPISIEEPQNRTNLIAYTAFLALLEAVLIVLIWYYVGASV